MSTLPKFIVSSVVRGSIQGDSHGGVYLVDMKAHAFEQVVNWNTCEIDFAGRGADRGLRGILIIGDEIYLAASDELFVFNRRFDITASYRNAYLRHCHEICLHRGKMYLTSTGFDSILRFDLATKTFDLGFALRRAPGGITAATFDPASSSGPPPALEFHINNVYADDTGIYISGRGLPALMHISANRLQPAAPLPLGTHNARPYRGGVLFNDTESDCLAWMTPGRRIAIPVPSYDAAKLISTGLDESGLARQAFGRGLCPVTDNLIAAGSSPTTIALHDLEAGRCVDSFALTMDVRNAAHGLAIWPFG